MKKRLNATQAAKYLGYSSNHMIYKLTHQKRIPFHKCEKNGRSVWFDPEELDEYKESNIRPGPKDNFQVVGKTKCDCCHIVFNGAHLTYFKKQVLCGDCLNKDFEKPTLATYTVMQSNFGYDHLPESHREKSYKQQFNNEFMRNGVRHD